LVQGSRLPLCPQPRPPLPALRTTKKTAGQADVSIPIVHRSAVVSQPLDALPVPRPCHAKGLAPRQLVGGANLYLPEGIIALAADWRIS
jgi:hypothetical protein